MAQKARKLVQPDFIVHQANRPDPPINYLYAEMIIFVVKILYANSFPIK